ncbi:MAG: S8 family peptidase [Saprospiraceae bacterium]|nr:S8 family peptidase [Saprospiraceae bacterium]
MYRSLFSTFLFSILVIILQGQVLPPDDWFHKDSELDNILGISTDRTYNELLKGREGQTVVVAILDSGVDADHEDLNDVMWVNHDEIPGNNKDDDNNGYKDDIHGWNFIGGPDGKNVHHDTYEVTRLYAKYKYKYENADRDKLTRKQRDEYDKFIEYKKVVEKEREKAAKNLSKIEQSEAMLVNAIDALAEAVGDASLNMETIDSLEQLNQPALMIGINVYKEATSAGVEISSIEDMKELLTEELQHAKDYYSNKLEYAYNPDFNPRKIIGDDYSDPNEWQYGNNDVEGPDAAHGTHVAGIVAAERNNGIGINGISKNAVIMSVRTVPDGDERDKDVANAIRYAVDNGASVINMSFGKGQSWNKEIVDEAVKYAAKHDVLLVHAAGNSNQDNDRENNFPNDLFEKSFFLCKGEAKNWLEVGALSYQSDENMIASFSNYGRKGVDVFAPGVAMYSTVPGSEYQQMQGTSMAAPVVAGIAATIRSYFPTLTAEQVKEIIMESTIPITSKVKRPGDNELVEASEISVTGGVVNLYKAIKLAQETKGKSKARKSRKWRQYDEAWEKVQERRDRA